MVMPIILTHEHADAALGLDDVRALQSFSPTNDIDPTPVYLSRSSMDSVLLKFPYLIKKKLREGQEVRRVAKLDWKIVKEDCHHHPFVASGVEFVPLPVMHGEDYISLGFLFGHFCLPQTLEAVRRLCPKRFLLVGMGHDFDHNRDNQFQAEWSKREGILVQLAHDGLRIPIDM
ncbi:Metallo-hydrolase/oxidoreductase superfamily protein [Euphorbia peplus]|nr:Metallo-hydrolase/oxidoreductase superfamily protein [Euphorbia peplus]